MKIGIVTFWTSNGNYGQLLQCWALQQQLIKMGHEPFLIRFKNSKKTKRHIIIRVLKVFLIYPVVNKIIKEYKVKQVSKKNQLRNFDAFREKFIIQSDLLYNSIDGLRVNPPLADCYMTGSDQGWAQLINNENNKAYFLDFGDPKLKRVSYAPSFAMGKYPNDLKSELKKLLLGYNSISVREKSGVMICKDLGIIAKHVLDPTMLLSKKEYLDLLKIKEKSDSTLFIYSLNLKNKEDMRWKELEEYTSKRNLKTIVTVGEGLTPANEVFGKDANYDYPTIEKWIANINNADAVVTSSFHGLVFSIIMETSFVFIPYKGDRERFNDRIYDLLSAVGMEDRILTENRSYKSILSSKIEWGYVRKKLDAKRKDSIDFLYNSLI